MAPKSINLRFRVQQHQILHSSPNAQTSRRERAQKVNDVPHIQVPIPRQEAPHQAPHARVLQADLSRNGVVALAAAQGVLLDVEGEVEKGGEGVCELEDADGGDDGREARESGDGGADDEGDGPVDGDDGHPEEFSVPVGEGRGVEEFDAYVVVEDCGERMLARGSPSRMRTRWRTYP